MNTREKILEALHGKLSKGLTLTSYDILWDQMGIPLESDEVMRFREKGLGITAHVETYRIEQNPSVQEKTEQIISGGHQLQKHTYLTPVGTISMTSRDGWVQEYYLKDPEDYRVMEYIIQNRKVVPDYTAYQEACKRIGNDGVVIVTAQRTPLQKILVDYAGLEQFSYHLVEAPEEVMSLYHTLLTEFCEIIKVVAAGPGEVIKIWENLTGDAIGGERFRKFLTPVYRKIYPEIKKSGKLLCLHYDGRLQCVRKEIQQAPFDILESFTPPPEGDVALEDAFSYWKEKTIWLTIPAFAYDSDETLRNYIRNLQRVSEGEKLIIEIAEHFPQETWKTQIALILKLLSEQEGE